MSEGDFGRADRASDTVRPSKLGRHVQLVEADETHLADLLQSTGWKDDDDVVSLAIYFIGRSVYPHLAEICDSLKVVPVHETQSFNFACPRPHGAISVTANFELVTEKRLQIDVSLQTPGNLTWGDGRLSFLLLKRLSGGEQ